jgi:hypothetical protein
MTRRDREHPARGNGAPRAHASSHAGWTRGIAGAAVALSILCGASSAQVRPGLPARPQVTTKAISTTRPKLSLPVIVGAKRVFVMDTTRFETFRSPASVSCDTFTLRDFGTNPATRAPYTATDTVTLTRIIRSRGGVLGPAPNQRWKWQNRRWTAGGLLLAINGVQRRTCAQGYSLRERRTGPAVKLRVDGARLEAQRQVIRRSGRPLQESTEARLQSIERAQSSFRRQLSQVTPGTTPRATYTPYDWEKHIPISLGSADAFQASLNHDFALHGDRDVMTASMRAHADVSILGMGATLAELSTAGECPTTSSSTPARLTQSLTVLGMDVPLDGGRETTGDSLLRTYDYDRSLRQGYESRFSIGPVPMSLEIGFDGSFRITGGVAANAKTGELNFRVVPVVYAAAYVQLAVDVVLVEAGVEGDLTLINEFTTPDLRIRCADRTTPNPYFLASQQVDQSLKLLQGSLSIYVEVDYFFGSEKWDYVLWSESGLDESSQPVPFHEDTLYPLKNAAITISVDSLYCTALQGATPGTERFTTRITVWPHDCAATLMEQLRAGGADAGAMGLAFSAGSDTSVVFQHRVPAASDTIGPNGGVVKKRMPEALAVAPAMTATVGLSAAQSPFIIRVRLDRDWVGQLSPGTLGQKPPYLPTSALDVSPGETRYIWLEYDALAGTFREWGPSAPNSDCGNGTFMVDHNVMRPGLPVRLKARRLCGAPQSESTSSIRFTPGARVLQ